MENTNTMLKIILKFLNMGSDKGVRGRTPPPSSDDVWSLVGFFLIAPLGKQLLQHMLSSLLSFEMTSLKEVALLSQIFCPEEFSVHVNTFHMYWYIR